MNKTIETLISNLSTQGIIFSIDTEKVPIYNYDGEVTGERELENVIFSKGERKVKISNRIFFRESGLSRVLGTVSSKDNTVKVIVVTDDMFYNSYKDYLIEYFK